MIRISFGKMNPLQGDPREVLNLTSDNPYVNLLSDTDQPELRRAGQNDLLGKEIV